MEELSSRNLLAVSWTMSPLVMPQALQASRLQKTLVRQGWGITVPDAPPFDFTEENMTPLCASGMLFVTEAVVPVAVQ